MCIYKEEDTRNDIGIPHGRVIRPLFLHGCTWPHTANACTGQIFFFASSWTRSWLGLVKRYHSFCCLLDWLKWLTWLWGRVIKFVQVLLLLILKWWLLDFPIDDDRWWLVAPSKWSINVSFLAHWLKLVFYPETWEKGGWKHPRTSKHKEYIQAQDAICTKCN